MNIILFTHPSFVASQSMPRFAKMLLDGMQERGHMVQVWTPKSRFSKLPIPRVGKKWLGYIDQYFLFPLYVKRRLKRRLDETLFVFADQALGPWMPLVSNLKHVIHCHDFLAQRSAMGEINENSTSWTGKQYQRYIRRGYSKGKNFISVSNKTKEDLHQFLFHEPVFSQVVYNGLNQSIKSIDPDNARRLLSKQFNLDLSNGYILHVGGNQWYKNRKGVIELYNAWRETSNKSLPLLLIGEKPSEKLVMKYKSSPFQSDIYFLHGVADDSVQQAYSGATLFLFPSLAEGFGWPIAEAMACGCPVITTNEAPMTEVAGNCAFFIPRMPSEENQIIEWSCFSSTMIDKIINLSPDERNSIREAGFLNAKRFDPEQALDEIERIYKNILQTSNH